MSYEQEKQYIRIGKLVAQEILGTITKEDALFLQNFLNSNSENRSIYDELKNEQQRNLLTNRMQKFNSDEAFERFSHRISRPPVIKHLWLRTAAIAAIVALAILSIYLFSPRHKIVNNSSPALTADAMPGGNKATLRLADGKIIELDHAQTGTTLQDGDISITKTADGLLTYEVKAGTNYPTNGHNTITTPNGGQYNVVLPDGSKIWLNAASSLTYTASLKERGEDKRRVTLRGEAYFEIAKDKAHPFVVRTGAQEIEVLGTHFNVNSYSDEAVSRTTLFEGSVRIRIATGRLNKILVPGQQAIVSGEAITVSPADMEAAMAWKNGLFAFKDADIPTIMRQLSRWYNVEIEYANGIPKDLFTGGISRNSNLSTVLKMLELIKIKAKIIETENGKKLVVNQ